ncbi:nicotinate phosphoribosyltransferase [bacterium]|nr:nicotinate phosphoribosyltransferase [bacterium]
MKRRSLVFTTDSYKVSHYLQFPKNRGSYYYIESRGGADEVLFFGLQAVIKRLLTIMPTKKEVKQAANFWAEHGVKFNKKGWLELVKLGYYPLEIRAVEEGKLVKTKEVQVTIESTDDRFGWLPGWVETRILQLWYPVTVATKQFECKKVILEYLKKTGTPEQAPFKLHSFGYRGVSSEESAGIGGSAELLTSMGTDTVAGIFEAQDYYNTSAMLGFSINAAEHSTVTAWGKEFEADAYENLLNEFLTPGAMVAVVSDSYNLSNANLKLWGGKFKDRIINSGGTLIVRPDSGEPSEIVLRTLEELGSCFGTTLNDKGYKVLPDCIRVIQGDGLNGPEDIRKVLVAITDAGWSADNVAFGMGGGSLQQVNRDTYKYAMKMSAIFKAGKDDQYAWADVFKEPADAPWKKSKRGRFDALRLPLVWRDGRFFRQYKFEKVRANAMAELEKATAQYNA